MEEKIVEALQLLAKDCPCCGCCDNRADYAARVLEVAAVLGYRVEVAVADVGAVVEKLP